MSSCITTMTNGKPVYPDQPVLDGYDFDPGLVFGTIADPRWSVGKADDPAVVAEAAAFTFGSYVRGHLVTPAGVVLDIVVK